MTPLFFFLRKWFGLNDVIQNFNGVMMRGLINPQCKQAFDTEWKMEVLDIEGVNNFYLNGGKRKKLSNLTLR